MRAGDGAVCLPEGLKDKAYFIGWNSGSRIRNGKMRPDRYRAGGTSIANE